MGPLGSVADVRDLVRRLLRDDLVVLPIRHHSPACALQVARAIEERRPSVVLVEGPHGFDPLIPLLAAPDAEMPLAVYTYAAWPATDDGDAVRLSAYHPFCDYSPELVALRVAASNGTPVRFIDLDVAEQRGRTPGTAAALDDERRYSHSAALARLAEQRGCRDAEDLWESLFEQPSASLADHVAGVAAYCWLARHDHTDADLVDDGTASREAEMAWHVARALAERGPGDGPVLVVLGGFHAVALPDLLADPPPRPVVARTDVRGDSVLIRYTFERMDRLLGYGAGMSGPAWHQRVWEELQRAGEGDPRDRAALATLLDIGHELRSAHQLPVPQPTLSAAYEQAVRLAHLREHGAPLRTDLVDAVTSCVVKGDADVEGMLVDRVVRSVLTGRRTGVLPPGTASPPLVGDALRRLEQQRVPVDRPGRHVVRLDLYRSRAHRATSRLLHGLVLLDVGFAIRTAGPDFVAGSGTGRLHEHWSCSWTPEVEGALAEAAGYGDTVPAAVGARFSVVLDEHRGAAATDAGEAVGLLARACVLGLHDRISETVDLVRAGIANDPTFAGPATAAGHLALLAESREPLDARDVADLPRLVEVAYLRAVHQGRQLADDDAGPDHVVGALARLRELLGTTAGRDLDPAPYWGLVEDLARRHPSSLVRGGATGLLLVTDRLAIGELRRRLHGHLTGLAAAEDAVAFVRGLLLTAREAAWQRAEVVEALDERLRAWDQDDFVRVLPDLRLAFAALTPIETDKVASKVAGLHGLDTLGSLRRRDVEEQDVQHLAEVGLLASDLLARDGLGSWVGR